MGLMAGLEKINILVIAVTAILMGIFTFLGGKLAEFLYQRYFGGN